jgi:hypothetical protein
MVQGAHIEARQRYGIAAAIGCNAINAVGLNLWLRGVSGIMIGLIAAMGGIATLTISPFASVDWCTASALLRH